jgi:diadenosine tetraphosphate (Ap4A) HIT family hydrolase
MDLNFYNKMDDFTLIPKDQIVFENNYFFMIYDAFPVSPGHILIISKRLVPNYFELNEEELVQLNHAIIKAKSLIDLTFNPIGYNIGMNCGLAAGQTIFHFHCHIIPRYQGDTQNPSGGVRGVIPNKQHY